MSRRQRWAARLKKVKIPVYCYLLAVIIWLIVSAVSCIGDGISRANGSLAEQHLAAEDFALYDMELQPDGRYLCTSDDPQMILSSLNGQVRTLRFWADYSGNSFEMNLYYTTSPDPERSDGRFGETRRVWPVIQDDGSYLFTLPRQTVYALRLDPASAPASQKLKIDFNRIIVNEPTSALSYFNPGWAGLVMLLILPAFLAALVRWLLGLIRHYRSGKRHKPSNTA